MLSVRFQAVETEKRHKIESSEILGGKIKIKKIIRKFGQRNFVRPPKLDAKSLPMDALIPSEQSMLYLCVTIN